MWEAKNKKNKKNSHHENGKNFRHSVNAFTPSKALLIILVPQQLRPGEFPVFIPRRNILRSFNFSPAYEIKEPERLFDWTQQRTRKDVNRSFIHSRYQQKPDRIAVGLKSARYQLFTHLQIPAEFALLTNMCQYSYELHSACGHRTIRLHRICLPVRRMAGLTPGLLVPCPEETYSQQLVVIFSREPPKFQGKWQLCEGHCQVCVIRKEIVSSVFVRIFLAVRDVSRLLAMS